ncbi:MAG: peptidase S45 [Candidatus Kapaibacterium sp.]|nr:MAG: peptidase S45 [Candidatus Kapabacteria bacterium]
MVNKRIAIAESQRTFQANDRTPPKGPFVGRAVAFLVASGSILVAIIGLGLYLALTGSSSGGEELETSAASDTVTVYRNNFAIPHIVARRDEDAFVALGYVHAHDRLWQMELYRRIANGELAEIFGDDFLQTDVFFRTLGLGHLARTVLLRQLSAESKRVLSAYTRGVNLFIEQNRRRLPFEFGALGVLPRPWKEADCLAIGKLMAFDLSMSFWADIALGEIADRHGVETALRLIPQDPPSTTPRVLQPSPQPTALQSDNQARSVTTPAEHTSIVNSGTVGIAPILHAIGTTLLSARSNTSLHTMGSGSNSWAVRLSSNGQFDAVLANDPHLVLGLPARWYQVHLTAPSFNAVGMTLPGLPAMLSGRNDAIAWGVTNVMLDDCDYFIELRDSTHPNMVIHGSGRLKVHVRFDTIHIRNKPPHQIRIETVAGRPILSNAHPTAFHDSIIAFPPLRSGIPLAKKYAISVAWTGFEPSDEIASSIGILKARSWTQFRRALQSWGAPALNFTYADIRGNIGIQPAGFVPVRDSGHPNLPRPGWIPGYRWQRVLVNPFPAVYNPACQFVLSANNKTSDSLRFFVSTLWEPSSRAERIAELLSLHRDYSPRDAQLEQLDQYSPYARSIKTIVEPVLTQAALDSIAKRALLLFHRWNCYLHPNSAAATAYSVFLERLMHIVFRAHLHEDEYYRYSFIASLPLRRIVDILEAPTIWLDADSTTAYRLRDRAIVQAWNEAVTFLERQQSPVPEQWRWGQLHRLRLEHPLARIPAYRTLLQRELSTIGGDATTIANGLWRVHKPFNLAIGASMRQVHRLRDTVVYSIVPGGVSGDPLSPHFADQLTLWANGGLIAIPTAPYPNAQWTISVRLLPQSQ